MGRLKDKNILLVIPSDYYDEEQLEPLMQIFKDDGVNKCDIKEIFNKIISLYEKKI